MYASNLLRSSGNKLIGRSVVRFKTTDAQRSAFEYYRRQRESTLWFKLFGRRKQKQKSLQEKNIAVMWYAISAALGALGAAYAAVPLYKVFCQTTGFGGTTQRVNILNDEDDDLIAQANRKIMEFLGGLPIKSTARVHTWTDEEAEARLASLKPVANADLITVRFDTTVTDSLPWTFEATQLDVKVVPGETALSFFRVTNHSDKAITGVATYNVHPPKVGLYFQKIQCFCFEEQRILPGETVDMPVFFFIDPEFVNDPQVSYVKSVTLSYTFFQTDEDWEDLDDEESDDSIRDKAKHAKSAAANT